MNFLVDKTVDLSNLIENQFPQFVREDSSTFINFIKSYYQSQELKNQPLDIAENLIQYYNVSYFRKSELVETTKLLNLVTESDTTINVKSTTGFPEKGYIKIDDEIIYYGSKTLTQFKECVRGTSALVLESIPLSEVLLKTSVADEHVSDTDVVNIAYAYTSEFLRRVKTEIAVGIPENLVEELEISTFLANVRSFYSSKGSLNSHRILFRILFNDKKIRFKLKPRGSGAELKIINFAGSIGNAQVTTGGSGYDTRKENNVLINPPLVEIFGSGTGSLPSNTTAKIEVSDIVNGSIVIGSTIDPAYTGITIIDSGQNYVGPITAFVREKDFSEEEIVTSGTGTGVVESWDFNTNELTLTNVVGFFTNNDELVSSSGEQARGYISSFEYVSQDPDIEFPKDYLLRPSTSKFVGKKIARIEIISGSLEEVENDKIIPPSYLTLTQKQDSIFGVETVSIESSSISKIDNIGYVGYEIDIDVNDDFNSLYLPASTQLTNNYNAGDSIVTVDDATGFPVTNGIIYIDGLLVEYKERTSNQFLQCTTTSQNVSKLENAEVISYGRYKTRREYQLSEYVKTGQERYYGDNLYVANTTGKTSSTQYPTHGSDTVKVGNIEWTYIGDSKIDYFLTAFVGTPDIEATGNEGDLFIFVESSRKLSIGQTVIGSGIAENARIVNINGKKVTLSLPNTSKVSGGCVFSKAKARVVGVVDEIKIESGGALFSNQIYEFDDKNYPDFSGVEYSSWNVNDTHNLDTDGDYIGITSIYDSTDEAPQNIYVSSSAIPPYTTGKNRELNNTVDGYTNAFNTGLTTPVDEDSIFVFRNAVLQDSRVDFSIVNNTINFSTVPIQTEELYLRYFSTPNQLTKITFTQRNTDSILLNTTDSLIKDEIFVFLNGVLQVGSSFVWDDTTKVVTFTNQTIDVNTDDIIVFSVDGADVLDSITTTSSLTYTLQNGGTNHTTSTTESVIVAVNGVVQKPSTSYIINGSTITFGEVNIGATLTIIECGSGLVSTTLTTLNGINRDRNNYKLQKLFKRISYPSGLLNNNIVRKSKAVTPTKPSKAFGITVDGIQYQSINGNTTEYGAVTTLSIDNGGNYFVPYTSNGSFDKANYPKIILQKNGGETSDITVTENIVEIAASITKINFNLFDLSIIQNLGGFTVKPTIEVISNNSVNVPTPANFRKAILDISFKDGYIDNIIVVDGGYGYTETPTIRISGGGNFTTYDIPFVNPGDGEILVEMSGPIISSRSESSTIELTSELGSSFTKNPTVVVNDGSDAIITTVVANGKVVATQIQNSGQYYWTEPVLKVISSSGIGSGAVLRPVLSNGRIIDVTIVNPGTGYVIPPVVSVNNTSTNAIVSSQLKKWTFNIANRFITGVDKFGGYVFDEQFGSNYTVTSYTTSSITLSENFTANDIIAGMEVTSTYVPYGTFVSLVDVSNKTIYLSNTLTSNSDFIGTKVSILQGDDRIRGSLKVSEVLPTSFPESRLKYQYLQLINTPDFEAYYQISNSTHSKIVGWSYDGHPIYCKYGFTSALDLNSGISEQTSSYRLKGQRLNGPSVTEYPMGSFVEDYEYIDGHGTLDQYNGRFCVTPDFPNGAYCYFMVDEYPHVIGSSYFSDPDCYNLGQNRTNDRIPNVLTRVNRPLNDQFPEEIKNINKTLLKTNTTGVGSIDSIFIEDSGKDYKTGDYLIFDNGGTSGSGAIAYVSSVESPPVVNIAINNQDKEVEFEFSGPHNISAKDVVYIDVNKSTSQTTINLDTLTSSFILNGKQVYTVDLEKNKIYNLTFGGPREFNLSFDSLNFNPYYQRNIILTNDSVRLDPENIPSKLFIHTPTSIFELNTIVAPIVGRYIVKSSTTNRFIIPVTQEINNVVVSELDFSIRSRGASGSIKTINIVNGGSGYRTLPKIIGVQSDLGTGAILTASSNTVGELKSISYVSYGDQFYGSRNVRNYVKLPITIKVKQNFKISNIEITDRGQNYLLNPYYRINGQSNLADLRFSYSAGEVVNVEVLDGGSGFSNEPLIELFSQNGGSGAGFKVSIDRRPLNKDDFITNASGSKAKIVNFDSNSSTLELLVENGSFKVDDEIFSSDGRTYGVIVELNTAKAYTKSNSYGNIREKFLGSVGFLSDDYQRIEDNVYYQDWSYTIVNERNTKEWRKEVVENTHPSGFRLFGKSRIHGRKSILGRSQNIVRSAVTFKASISSLLDAKIKTPPCKKQIIWIDITPNPYDIYDLVYGTQSEAIGLVVETGDNYIIVELFDKEVEINEFIINFLTILTTNQSSETSKTLLNVNGILQKPFTSYTVTATNIEPTFPIFPQDELVSYFLTTSFDDITPSGVNAGNQVNLTVGGLPYTVADRDKLIVSLNGVIQRNTNFTLVNNSTTIEFTGSTIQDKPNFVLYHPELSPITFSGSAGTDFDLGFTPSDNCQLLVFFEGVNQSYLLTDYTVSGSTITFASSVNPSEIFGWYIDEPVVCEDISISGIFNNQIVGKSLICNEEKNVTLKIYSDTVKKPKGFFEFEKETLDGTAFVDTDGTTVYGFGSRFQYSNPEYSTSHVEVINDISSQFDGTAVTFDLKINQDDDYTPWDGENSLLVEQSGSYVPKSEYSVTGSQITFVNAPTGPMSIRDFKSAYIANDNTKKGAELDQFNVFNGVRTRFNTSDDGVPSTASNNTDVFHIKNGVLVRPDIHLNADDSRTNIQLQTVSNNKITFTTAPVLSDSINMLSFNRQLVPTWARNWVYDRNEFFDGVRREFTLLHDNTNTGGSKCEELRNEAPSEESLVVIRNGVYQYPSIDYDLILENDVYDINNGASTHRIVFTTPPTSNEDVFILFHEYSATHFEDRTDELTQTSSTVLSYTTAITNYATKVPFVYVDGVYQDQDSYTWDGAANTLTFSGANLPDLATQNIEFHAKTGTLNPANVYGDILSAWLLVLQRGASSTDLVKITTTNNTYDVVTRTGTVTISGLDVVTVQTRTGSITMASEHYLINLLNLNGNIMHDDPANNFVAFDGVTQEPGVAYDHSGTGTAGLSTIGNTRMYDNMTIPLGIGYLAAIDIVIFTDGDDRQYMTNEINQVYDGSRTRFRVTLDGVKDNTYTGHEDLIVSKNNVVLEPDVDYHLTNVNGYATDSAKGCIDFTVAPVAGDEIFTIMMHENEKITLTAVNSTTYNLSRTLTAVEQEGLILIQNDQVKLALGRGFTFTSGSQIQFDSATTTGTPFGILTQSGTVLDYINTPYDGTRKEFNMFLDEENFIPAEQYDGTLPHPENIVVYKNGTILTPISDYTLDGTINSRINFTTAPLVNDLVYIFTHGVMRTLDSITATSATTYDLNVRTGRFDFASGISGVGSDPNNTAATNTIGTWNIVDYNKITWTGNNSGDASYFHVPNVLIVGQQYTVTLTVTGFSGGPPGVGVSQITTGPSVSTALTFNGSVTRTFTAQSTDFHIFGWDVNAATLTVQFTGPLIPLPQLPYYADALIGRPRELENQLLITSNGLILDPREDYYILGDKINFRSGALASGDVLRIRDYYGDNSDVDVESYGHQVSVGDIIEIPGESEFRTVTDIHSPSVMSVTNPVGNTSPNGFAGTVNVSSGSVSGITVNSGGVGYPRNTKLRTYGLGTSASANVLIDPVRGDVITTTTIDNEGWNISTPTLVPTYELAVVREQLLSSSDVCFGTKLSSNITNSDETIPVAGTSMAFQSDITITVSSSTGGGAVFQPFVVNGKLTKVEIVNGGSGYNDLDFSLSVNNGGGTGAVLEGVLDVNGTITSITVINEGVGYVSYRAFIGNECIEYTNHTSNELKGVTRGRVGTTAQSATQNDKVIFAECEQP